VDALRGRYEQLYFHLGYGRREPIFLRYGHDPDEGFAVTVPMLAVQRQEHIIRQLETERIVQVAQLAAALGVTEKTVREDLEKLEEQGFLRRIRGGAVALSHQEAAAPPPVPNLINPAEKTGIARSEEHTSE